MKNRKKIRLHTQHGIIPYMFEYWAVPVVYLLLQKGSMDKLIEPNFGPTGQISSPSYTRAGDYGLWNRDL